MSKIQVIKKLFIFLLLVTIFSCKKEDSSVSLIILKNNNGIVNYESGKQPIGEKIVLEATPDPGYAFVGWHGEGLDNPTDENPLTIVLDSEKSIVANFVNIENPDFSGIGLWTDELYSKINYDIENNFKDFVEIFVKDAERHGLDLSYVLDGSLEFEIKPDLNSAGAAAKTCNDDAVKIFYKEFSYLRDYSTIKSGTKCIDCAGSTFWGKYKDGPKAGQEFYGDIPRMILLMYHEFGHDILNLAHTCIDGQLVNAPTACEEGISSLKKDMYGFSWYSNDPRYSFRAAVKDLFDGFNQNCYDCKDPLALRICSLIN